MAKACKHGRDTERFTEGSRKGRCKECSRADRRAYNTRRYYRDIEAGRARSRATQASQWAKNPERMRENGRRASRKRLGGIDPPGHVLTGPCENLGCGYVGPLEWDHDHAITDRANERGWLCSQCNTALGQIEDSVPRLLGLVQYLTKG